MNGVDPFAQCKSDRAVPTFRAVAETYMAKHVQRRRKARAVESYGALLRLHLLPALAGICITDIQRSHVEALHDSMSDRPGAANRALSVFSAIWTWAAIKAYADLNLGACPAKGIEPNREEGRERYLTIDELGQLGEALTKAETDGLPYIVDAVSPKSKHAPKAENRIRRIDPFAVAAIRLLIFTGGRLREILHARWNEIDFEAWLGFASTTFGTPLRRLAPVML